MKEKENFGKVLLGVKFIFINKISFELLGRIGVEFGIIKL